MLINIFDFEEIMAPVDGTPKNVTPDFAFKLVSEGKANDLVDVKKYRSSRTGLTVVIADVDGPVVNGYFCLGNCLNFK